MHERSDLIYDWNTRGSRALRVNRPILVDDESLRDGLQSPSLLDPPVEKKVRLLGLMEKLGIHAANIGFPAANQKMYQDVRILAEKIRDDNLKILPNCAARTIASDIQPIIDISHKVEHPIEVCAFIGSSPIRQFIENWKLDTLLDLTEKAITLSVDNNMPTMFVTEDTTRANPEDLKALYLRAVELGAHAVCISDTVGHATPDGAYNIVSYIKETLHDHGYKDTRIDWHGHRDRDLGLANALAAIEAGADRIHAAVLGIGERTGNVAMDTLLVNLKLYGIIDNDLSVLREYTELGKELVNIPIPPNYPIVGKDAFRTATGVHAAAIIKAKKMGLDLADMVYSGVPAGEFGFEQKIELGPLSGLSNVFFRLEELGYKDISEQTAQALLKHTKQLGRLISDEEILRFMHYT